MGVSILDFSEFIQQKFFERVARNIKIVGECHVWDRVLDAKGYPTTKVGYVGYRAGPTIKVHRAVCERKNGPLGKLCAMHTCDNRACVNPDHIIPGTHDENMADMAKKKRHADFKGQKHPAAKLTDRMVIDIRKRLINGERKIRLAEYYGVTASLILAIGQRRIWSHLPTLEGETSIKKGRRTSKEEAKIIWQRYHSGEDRSRLAEELGMSIVALSSLAGRVSRSLGFKRRKSRFEQLVKI